MVNMEIVGKSFKEEFGNLQIEIVVDSNGIYELGFHEKKSEDTIFGLNRNKCLSQISFDDLIQFRKAVNKIIERIENDDNQSIDIQ